MNRHPGSCPGPGICAACDDTLEGRASRNPPIAFDPPVFPVHIDPQCEAIEPCGVHDITTRPEWVTCPACVAAMAVTR